MNDPSQFAWYVVAARQNRERAVSVALREKGFEIFLPVYRVSHKWSDRNKEIEVPLFTGYTFCRMDPRHRLPVLQIPGVVSILGFPGTGPVAVDETEIEALRALLRSNLAIGPWPFLREGTFVTVERGPLIGVEGIIVEVKSKCRLVVSVSLLQRSVYAEIDREWVVPHEANPLMPASSQYSFQHA